MGTNKTISTDNTISLRVLSFSSQIPGYEKIKISARKMEMSPEKIDDVRILRGLQPPSPPARTPMSVLLMKQAKQQPRLKLNATKNLDSSSFAAKTILYTSICAIVHLRPVYTCDFVSCDCAPDALITITHTPRCQS